MTSLNHLYAAYFVVRLKFNKNEIQLFASKTNQSYCTNVILLTI